MKGLQGKVALVTGGSSGIGQAIAIRLGEEGANVAINYVGRPEGAISTKEAIEHGVEICMKKMSEAGGRPILVGADVSDEQAVERMFDRVMSEYGRLDILINNAGIQIAADSDELSAADFDKVLAVNLPAIRSPRAACRTSPGRWRSNTPRGEYGSTAWARALPSRRSTGRGSTTRSSDAWSKAISRCGARAAPRRWLLWRRSCALTRRRTSPGRHSLSTVASPSTPHSRRHGRLSDDVGRVRAR